MLKRESLRQQAAEDGAFAARLLLACVLFGTVLWFALPPCGQAAAPRDPGGAVRAPAQQPHAGEQPAGGGGPAATLGGGLHDADDPALAGRVARTIHQYHPSKDVPERYRQLQDTWRMNHPSWGYKLWTQEEVEALVREHLPWFLQTYQELQPPSIKDELARYVILYVNGGLFAANDVASNRPIEPLLRGCSGLVALLSDDLPFPENVPSALLASAPRHPLWLDVLHVAKALTGGGRSHFPRDLPPSAVLKAATSRFAALQGAAGGAAAAAAARAPRLASAAAVRRRAADALPAVRVLGLCAAPAGAAYPFDYHVPPGTIPDESFLAAAAAACSLSSPKFGRSACGHALGTAAAAAYAIAYWEHAPPPDRRLLRRPGEAGAGWQLLGLAAAVLMAAAAAALLLPGLLAWARGVLMADGGGKKTPPGGGAQRRRRGERDALLPRPSDELA